jgi:arylsulfatase A-like enzyme
MHGDAALREGDWKLIADPESKARFASTVEFIAQAKPKKFRLYNLAQEPREDKDVAAQEPERVKVMAARLTALHLEMQAEAPRWPETALPPQNRKQKATKGKATAS